jgi:hypothetical protein
VRLTQWKIRALRLEALIDAQGSVDRHDFKHLQLDHRFFTARGNQALRAENGRWVPDKHFPRFSKSHPVVFGKIKADIEQWRPKPKPEDKPVQTAQPAML